MGDLTKLLANDGEGERLDRFELIAELASGGMATVFLARLSGVAGFQRLVAIKRLHPHLAREAEFVEMFLDEARLAARIHHPNVVPIQEVGESKHGYYLVMDYIEGDTLARVLARAAKSETKVPYGVTIRVLLDVLAGLHAAHEMKDDHGEPLQIVHRDVSPQNILVGVDGVARVVDFGVARAATRLSTTRSGQLKGKLAYMAPEQARGAATVDRRADLFACGIVLWEALATRRLFKGDGEAETLHRVLYEPIPLPSSVRADVPKPLEDICMKALSRDVEQRFATAQDFGDALEKAARAVDSVGSVRDVAACLQEVIGSDLIQQRDAVRAWLARSEPSHGTGPRSRPVLDSIVTRVEGGSKSEPSSAGRSQGGSAPSSMPRSVPADHVSSVSSSVIQVPAFASISGAGVPPSSPSRSRSGTGGRIAVALVAAGLLVGVGAWGARRLGNNGHDAGKTTGGAISDPRTAAPAAPAGSAASPLSAPPTPILAASGAVLPVSAVTTSSELAAEPAPRTVASAVVGAPRPAVRAGARPPASAKAGAPAVKPAAAPDDLGTNPYR